MVVGGSALAYQPAASNSRRIISSVALLFCHGRFDCVMTAVICCCVCLVDVHRCARLARKCCLSGSSPASLANTPHVARGNDKGGVACKCMRWWRMVVAGLREKRVCDDGAGMDAFPTTSTSSSPPPTHTHIHKSPQIKCPGLSIESEDSGYAFVGTRWYG